MITLDDVLDVFFDMLKDCVENITLPVGASLIHTLMYSTGIFAVSLICRLLGMICVIRWQGALTASVLLLILVIIERKGESEVLRLYRVVKAGAASLKGREARPSSDIEGGGSADASAAMHGQVSRPSADFDEV